MPLSRETVKRNTHTLKPLRSTTKYKRNTNSEILQKLRNTRKDNEKMKTIEKHIKDE